MRIVLFVITFTTIITDYGIISATAPATKLEPNTIDTIHQQLKRVQRWQWKHHHDNHHKHHVQPQPQQDGEGIGNRLIQSLPTRPFVTVAFAQSVDGYMSPFIYQDRDSNNNTANTTEHPPTTDRNYPLSSRESLVLTHGLRSIHDGILIGGRTLLLDNPRLTSRLWGIGTTNTSNEATTAATRFLPSQKHQPQPVIIDPNLRYIQQLLRETNGTMNPRHPIICCTFDAAASIQLNQYHYHRDDHHDNCFRNNITNNTIRLLPCQCNNNNVRSHNATTSLLNITDVFHQLYHRYNLRSVMVEGGAYTISTLFATTTTANALIDAIIITIAPQFLSSGIRPTFRSTLDRTYSSVGSMKNIFQIDTLRLIPSSTSFILLGNDATLIARCDQRRH